MTSITKIKHCPIFLIKKIHLLYNSRINVTLITKTATLCILLAHMFSVSAQDMSSFLFRKYQVNEGLSENTVTSIYQDKKGFLWLGTKDGLNKFDGINFTLYRNKFDNKSLGNNFVKSIADSGDSILYIGTNDGVYIMNRNTETFELLEQRLKVADKIITIVTSLLLDKQGRLWISSMYQGIYVFDPHKTELSRVRCSSFNLTKTNTWTIFMDKSGGIWAGTRIGLLQYNASNGMFEPVGDLTNYNSTSNMEIFKIFEDQKGNLWLGTWADGILCYNKQQKSHTAFCTINSSDFYITHIRDFLEYDSSNLLIGSDDGLYLFNMETNKTMRIDIPYESHSLGDQNVYSLLRDREKGIWVGTYFGGLNYLSPNNMNIKTYLPSQRPGGLSGKAISQFCEDKNRNLWVATEDGGVNYFDTKTEQFTQPIQTSYHNIHSLMLDNDQLWIGTFSRGIDIYNTKTKAIKNYRHNPNDITSLNDDCVFSIYKTKGGDIYVGTTIGLNQYNGQNGNFVRINSDSISFVYDIKEDSYKNLWIASYKNGVIKYDHSKNKWIYYSEILDKNNPIVNSRLTGIYIDDKKRVWFSSEGDGVFLYDYVKDNFTNISEIEGLPNNVTYGILDDQFGNLWISSNRGLVSFSPSNVADQKIVLQEDGLQGNEFNYKSSLKASNGRMYFGGINGFNSFYPQKLKENINNTVPTVEITGLKLLGSQDDENQEYIRQALNRNETIELQHNNSSISISYVSLSYVSQSKNQYAYKLEGVDEDWIYVGNNKNVTYVNLSPGKYTFKVKASNNHGVWSTQDAVLNFEILPPF